MTTAQEKENTRKAVRALVADMIPTGSTWAKVKSVSDQTCVITIDDGEEGIDIDGVLLGFEDNGIIVYPKVGSDVLVMFTDNTNTYGAVVLVKETEKVELMGNAKGGLAIVSELTKRYNKLEKDINKLKQVFMGWSPVQYDGGAALKVAVADWMGEELVETQDSDIENTKVKHGEG